MPGCTIPAIGNAQTEVCMIRRLARSPMSSSEAVATETRPWIYNLTPTERSTLLATFGGWGLDGMDVMIYSFVIPTLIAAWHMSKAQAGMLSTVALLISAVGGWLSGLLADRYGRTRVLQVTILWFAVFTCLSGFTNSFWQLLIVRGLQGLGFGGEWAVGSVLTGRSHSRRVSRQSGRHGARRMGHRVGRHGYQLYRAVFATARNDRLARDVLDRNSSRSPGLLHSASCARARGFPTHRGSRKFARRSSHFLEIFRPSLLETTLLTALLAVVQIRAATTPSPPGCQPIWKTTRKLSVRNTGGYLFVVIVGSFVGYLVSAWLSDRFGRKRTLVLFAVCSLLAIVGYTYLPIGNSVMLVLGFPLGFFASGAFSPVGAFFTELFPSRVRGSGQGFSYNVGRGIGALFPTLVGILSARMDLGHAISMFAAGAYLTMVVATLLLPETRGRELRAYE